MKKNIYLCILILAAVMSVLPLLALSAYDHPSADDFTYARDTYHVWQESGSVFQLLRAAICTSASYWNHWQGLYASTFLQSLQPAVFGEQFYAITGFLMLAILFAGNIAFSTFFIHRAMKGSKLSAAAIGCMMSFLMAQWMPSFVEGLYWYNGAMAYVLFFALLELLACLAASVCLSADTKGRVLRFAGSAFVGFLIAGGNLVTAFLAILLLIGITAVGFLFSGYRILKWHMITLAVTAGGFLLSVLSPGTMARQAYFEKSGVLFTIKTALFSGLGYMNSWISIQLIVCILLVFPFFYAVTAKFRQTSGFRFPCPLLVLIFSIGFICAMFCPPFYAMGNLGAGRLLNIVYFMFILLAFVNVFYLCGYVQEHFIPAADVQEQDAVSKWWVIAAICLFLGMTLASGKKAGAYFAIGLIRSGAAETYSAEAYARHEKYVTGKGKNVVVDAYSVLPPLLYFDDVTEDKKDWRNRAVKKFYDLKSVRVKP